MDEHRAVLRYVRLVALASVHLCMWWQGGGHLEHMQRIRRRTEEDHASEEDGSFVEGPPAAVPAYESTRAGFITACRP